jgi:ankyrin repeat protein
MDRVYFGEIQNVNVHDRKDSMTPLLISCKINNINNVRTLLELGADPNDSDDLGNSCLIYAVCYSDFVMVKLLCDAGANPHHIDKTGYSVMYWVKRHNDKKVVDYLNSKGCVSTFPRYSIEAEF